MREAMHLTRLCLLCLKDFWQIYFIVTQKDGVEAGDDAGLSLGSSWGMLSLGLSQDDSHTPLSQDDHHTGCLFPFQSISRSMPSELWPCLEQVYARKVGVC